MKKSISIFLFFFYSLGTFCLPMGDFSALQDLPEMYSQCKANEDKDMTPIDFITDHLINIDSLFDRHHNGDEQKPHKPTHIQNHIQLSVAQTNHYLLLEKTNIYVSKSKPSRYSDNFAISDFSTMVFRPPIVA